VPHSALPGPRISGLTPHHLAVTHPASLHYTLATSHYTLPLHYCKQQHHTQSVPVPHGALPGPHITLPLRHAASLCPNNTLRNNRHYTTPKHTTLPYLHATRLRGTAPDAALLSRYYTGPHYTIAALHPAILGHTFTLLHHTPLSELSRYNTPHHYTLTGITILCYEFPTIPSITSNRRAILLRSLCTLVSFESGNNVSSI